MILLISIVVIILLYLLLDWLYKEYKNDLEDIDQHTVHVGIRISDLERKVNMNEQMINWLWEQVAKEKNKQKSKEKKSDKNEK